jgi:hypothetical protein
MAFLHLFESIEAAKEGKKLNLCSALKIFVNIGRRRKPY